MVRNITKHKYIYLFIVVLSIIGFTSGYLFYTFQNEETKTKIIDEINIKGELNNSFNNLTKRAKEIGIVFISGILIIPEITNIFKIYYNPFEIGFIFNALKTYNIKFSLLYSLIYHIIPFIFILILIRLSFSISINIIKIIINKRKNIKFKRKLRILLKKYILISLIILFYEFLIFIFSGSINSYLMTIL